MQVRSPEIPRRLASKRALDHFRLYFSLWTEKRNKKYRRDRNIRVGASGWGRLFTEGREHWTGFDNAARFFSF